MCGVKGKSAFLVLTYFLQALSLTPVRYFRSSTPALDGIYNMHALAKWMSITVHLCFYSPHYCTYV